MAKESTKKAVVLMSGGLDSTTVVGLLLQRGFKVFPLSINYGQRHKAELESMKAIVKYYQDAKTSIEDVMELNLTDIAKIGGSALTDQKIAVPENKEIGKDIPITYVPGRNTIFLALALAYAEVKDCKVVGIGVNNLDYSGYPDCRPDYIQAMIGVAKLSSKRAVEGRPILIEAPLISMDKKTIIEVGMKCNPKVPYHLTWSCYNPKHKLTGGYEPCGKCDSCVLRAKGFREAGHLDMALKEEKSQAPTSTQA